MTTMNISLPDPMKQFVEEQVSSGGYSSASEYVRELVRAEQKRQAKEKLELELIEAMKSPAEEATPEYWARLRKEIGAEVRARRAAGK